MKKTIFISIVLLLLTGCSSDYSSNDTGYDRYDIAEVNICGEEFTYDELSEDAITIACDEYYSDGIRELIMDVDYENYCSRNGISDETECLENYRDEILSNIP